MSALTNFIQSYQPAESSQPEGPYTTPALSVTPPSVDFRHAHALKMEINSLENVYETASRKFSQLQTTLQKLGGQPNGFLEKKIVPYQANPQMSHQNILEEMNATKENLNREIRTLVTRNIKLSNDVEELEKVSQYINKHMQNAQETSQNSGAIHFQATNNFDKKSYNKMIDTLSRVALFGMIFTNAGLAGLIQGTIAFMAIQGFKQ